MILLTILCAFFAFICQPSKAQTLFNGGKIQEIIKRGLTKK